jgi:ribosomal protein S18 acetylase RimI-like enzyme
MTRTWTDDELRTRHRASLKHFYELVAESSDAARVVRRHGVLACVVPATPERSFPNAVVYDDADALAAALPDLERAYREAGVRAWTVWVPEEDRAAAQLLEKLGHSLDGVPAEMAAPLDELDLEPRRDLDLDPEPSAAAITSINDAAYDARGTFDSAFARFPIGEWGVHAYVAREVGEPVACAVAVDSDTDCEVCLVATLPAARGRGLCGELMRLALRDARDRGCETTSLEATAAGEPIYGRVGYRRLGTLQMWELRRSSP